MNNKDENPNILSLDMLTGNVEQISKIEKRKTYNQLIA
jgi:hypothetical protein